MYTYIVLSRVPSTPACYRGTLGFKEKSECICCGHASGIFSPRPLWFGGCATHATPCSVPGYSYFRMCLENLNTSYLYNAAILASFFLFACLKACFRLSLSTRNKKKRTITSKKHAYRPETSYVLYYSLNAVAFESIATPYARMSLCTQSVHSFSFPPGPLHTAPPRFSNTIRFGSRPPLIRMSVPAHKSLLVRKVISMPSHPVISRARLYEVIRWPGPLRCAPMVRSQTRWCTEFDVVFLAKGPRTASIQEGLDCLGLYHSGLEGERDFRLVVELP